MGMNNRTIYANKYGKELQLVDLLKDENQNIE